VKHIITAALFLATSAAYADTKTVSWYVAHPEARAKVYALCQDNPGQAKHVANCLNAAEAIKEASLQDVTKQINTATGGKTLLDMCDQMPGLFQLANRCGPLGGAGR
jgi:hypothetical protein